MNSNTLLYYNRVVPLSRSSLRDPTSNFCVFLLVIEAHCSLSGCGLQPSELFSAAL